MANIYECGAQILRGSVISADENGYRVLSYSCDGYTSQPIPALGNTEYAVGDKVYYFAFPDGHGMILAAFE